MALQIIDGTSLAEEVKAKIHAQSKQLEKPPILVDIVIGDDPKTQSFVKIKEKTASGTGIRFETKAYPKNFDPRLVHSYIQEQNQNTSVKGILIQLPLPPMYNQTFLLKAIHPFKDVDALHPKNLGLLVSGEPVFISPVTLGVLHIIRSTQKLTEETIQYLNEPFTVPVLRGVNICIIGAGLLVGKPLANMMINLGATVSVLNEYTQNPSPLLKEASIIVTGTNSKDILSPEDVSDNTLVIDVGQDVDKSRFDDKNIILSTNPGGIGPLTVAYLLFNTIRSATMHITQ